MLVQWLSWLFIVSFTNHIKLLKAYQRRHMIANWLNKLSGALTHKLKMDLQFLAAGLERLCFWIISSCLLSLKPPCFPIFSGVGIFGTVACTTRIWYHGRNPSINPSGTFIPSSSGKTLVSWKFLVFIPWGKWVRFFRIELPTLSWWAARSPCWEIFGVCLKVG